MKIKFYLLFLFLLVLSCSTDKEANAGNQKKNQDSEVVFDKEKWEVKDGKDYPYRDRMINDIVYNDTIRTLNKEQLIELLGNPDYSKEGHLYYKISETRLGNWPLNSKTMVIKLVDDKTVEWIKIHE